MTVDPGAAAAIIAFAVPGLVLAGMAIGKLVRGDKDGAAARAADKAAFDDALATVTDRLKEIEVKLVELLVAVTRGEGHAKTLEQLDRRQDELDRDLGKLRTSLQTDIAKLRQRVALAEREIGVVHDSRTTPVMGLPAIGPRKDDDA